MAITTSLPAGDTLAPATVISPAPATAELAVPLLLQPHPAAASVHLEAAPARAAQTATLITVLHRAATAKATKPAPAKTKTTTVVKRKTPAKQQPPAKARKATVASAPPAAAPAGGRVEVVVRFALAQVGKPYVWAAAGPGAYDCSGLTMAAYARAGIRLPHQSGGQASAGHAVSRAQLQRGDLILYSGHVAIALGGGMMVHAANPRTGVVVAKIYGNPIGYRRLL